MTAIQGSSVADKCGFFFCGVGVTGSSIVGTGVAGVGGGTGVSGYSISGIGVHGDTNDGYAGYFEGPVHCNGTLSKAGGAFKIDHPLDPENKYLSHSFIESPDMMNIYNGNVTTGERGYAEVTMPDWFEALNRDFRYQLTVVDDEDDDQFVLAKIVKEARDGRFTIRTSQPGVKVSWQVTGIRQDAYANAHRRVEEDKLERDRGKYLQPELFGQPENMAIHYRSRPAKGQASPAPER